MTVHYWESRETGIKASGILRVRQFGWKAVEEAVLVQEVERKICRMHFPEKSVKCV